MKLDLNTEYLHCQYLPLGECTMYIVHWRSAVFEIICAVPIFATDFFQGVPCGILNDEKEGSKCHNASSSSADSENMSHRNLT